MINDILSAIMGEKKDADPQVQGQQNAPVQDNTFSGIQSLFQAPVQQPAQTYIQGQSSAPIRSIDEVKSRLKLLQDAQSDQSKPLNIVHPLQGFAHLANKYADSQNLQRLYQQLGQSSRNDANQKQQNDLSFLGQNGSIGPNGQIIPPFNTETIPQGAVPPVPKY